MKHNSFRYLSLSLNNKIEMRPPIFYVWHEKLSNAFCRHEKKYNIKYSTRYLEYTLKLQYCDVLEAEPISKVLDSLYQMGRHFSLRRKVCVLSAIDRNAGHFNSQGITNIFLALN